MSRPPRARRTRLARERFLPALNEVESLLVALVGQRSAERIMWSELSGLNLSPQGGLFRAAHRNEVVPHLAHVLGRLCLSDPGHLHPCWELHHRASAELIRSYMAEMDRLAELLAGQGILVAALKNAGIARGIYPCPGCCPMGDLDLLVERASFRQAHRILLDDGYELRFRSPLESAEINIAERNGGAEYFKDLTSHRRLWLEIQWRPIAGRWLPAEQEPKAEALLARSLPIEGSQVRLLAPVDNLVQVCLHTAKHSYVRAPGFRLHTDVDRIVAGQEIDWDAFLNEVVSLQVATAVYFALLIPQQLFDTPIPPEVLVRLQPPGWKSRWIASALRRAGLLYPDRRKFDRLGYVAFSALLFDNHGSFLRSVFPSRDRMHAPDARQPGLLPLAYARHLIDLLSRRGHT